MAWVACWASPSAAESRRKGLWHVVATAGFGPAAAAALPTIRCMNRFFSVRRWASAAGVLCVLALGHPAVAQDLPDHMEQRLAACTGCHGPHGAGSPEDTRVPRLAGKPAGYLFQQLEYFRHGQRRHAPMEYVVRQLSPAYLRQIAIYFSRQEVPVHEHPVPDVADAVLERGRQLVEHGDAS